MRHSPHTTRLLTTLFAGAAVAVAGCSSDSNDTGGGACSIALTGGATSTITCTAAVAAYTPTTNQSALSLTTANQSFALSVGFTGTVHTGTFHSTDNGALGGITFTDGTTTWLASAGGGSNAGTWTITLTSVNTISSTAQGTAYSIRGSIDATLPPVGGSGTAVTLHATF